MGGQNLRKIADQYVNKSLTCTHAFFVPRLVSTVVTVQSPMIVTCVSFVAGFSQLFSTGLTAITAVCKQTDPQRAHRGHFRTFTGPLTVLCPVIQVHVGVDNWNDCGTLG